MKYELSRNLYLNSEEVKRGGTAPFKTREEANEQARVNLIKSPYNDPESNMPSN